MAVTKLVFIFLVDEQSVPYDEYISNDFSRKEEKYGSINCKS
jgi:hypothetical protein